jgi:hypothetical protein
MSLRPLGHLHDGQPEILDGFDHAQKLRQFDGLGDVAIDL